MASNAYFDAATCGAQRMPMWMMKRRAGMRPQKVRSRINRATPLRTSSHSVLADPDDDDTEDEADSTEQGDDESFQMSFTGPRP